MKRIFLLLLAATTMSAAQTPAPKTAPKAATTAHKPAVASSAAAGPKLPPGVPVVKGIVKSAFSLKYEDFKVGTGALAEPGKIYTVHYTGWLASDGKKFDSSYDHRQPVMDKDGKPENDADGKPKLGDAQPLTFPQGRGRLIPGWDQGFEGMHVGGKRRLFIPYQLAYGAAGRPPVIPAKADLIFDVELMEVADMPAAQGGPGAPGGPGGAAGRPMPRPAGAPTPGATPPPAPAPKPADAPKPGDTPADKPANPAQPQ
jgi:peptidylprolyl isomerase